MAKTPPIQNIYCPWCHAPVVFIGSMTLADTTPIKADRYDCAGPTPHTMLVMLKLQG